VSNELYFLSKRGLHEFSRGFIAQEATNWSGTAKIGNFYCAMHYNAKRGLAIRLSVRLSLTLVDQDNIA